MITLSAISTEGSGDRPELTASFTQAGGTLGRGHGNTLVLPDPEERVAPVHAGIVWHHGGFVLVANSPLAVNGEPVGADQEVAIGDGDTVQIAGYLLQVQARAEAKAAVTASVVHANPLGDAAGLFSDQVVPTDPTSALHGGAPSGVFGDFGVPAAASEDPFSELGREDLLVLPPRSGARHVLPAYWDAPAHPPPVAAAFFVEEVPADAPEVIEAHAAPLAAEAGEKLPVPSPALVQIVKGPSEPAAKAQPGVPESLEVLAVADAAPDAPILPDRALVLPPNLFAEETLASPETLLAALLDGLALPTPPFEQLTPALAHRLGATLREAIEGTFGLLQAQHRAGQLAPDGKGTDAQPLLDCATASEALLLLLAPPKDGAPLAQIALRRGYDDLQAAMGRALRLNAR